MSGDSYQQGYKAGYSAAKQFYGLAARERLERIQRATEELQADITASGGRPPTRLLRYLDEVHTLPASEIVNQGRVFIVLIGWLGLSSREDVL